MKNILLIILIFLGGCLKNNDAIYLYDFWQEELDEYLEELNINKSEYKILDIKKTKKNLWRIRVQENLIGGTCVDHYTGKILLRNDTLFLLADYIYNDPKYIDSEYIDAPVNNCSGQMNFIIYSKESLLDYIIMYENELFGTPVSPMFLEDYYEKFGRN